MDRLYTSGDVARMLGTSVPRVLRAARRGTVPTASHGNRTMFDARAVAALRQRWGAVPSVAGLRREEAWCSPPWLAVPSAWCRRGQSGGRRD